MRPKLNIYFAASIRGGRELAGRYAEIMEFLQGYGNILTRHVADDGLLDDEKSMTDPEIFTRDMAWLKKADLVIAEVTRPSIGVGYEIGAAVDMGLPVITLYNTGSPGAVSAMVSGNPGIRLVCYKDMDDLKEKMVTVLNIGEIKPKSE